MNGLISNVFLSIYLQMGRGKFMFPASPLTNLDFLLQVFITSGHSLRMLVPLGLNMCPPFHSISKALRGASILPPARTVIEDEMRRNVFWLAYATDRATSLGNGWAHGIDDDDVAQLLPVRGDQFNKGVRYIYCLLARRPYLDLSH